MDKLILKPSVRQKAIKITTTFEGTSYDTFTGNFDGQLMSVGLLQWNFGQGTLQPLLLKMYDKHKEIFCSIFGPFADGFVSSMRMHTISKYYSMNMSRNNTLHSNFHNMFKLLCATKEFQAIQDEAVEPYIQKAVAMCRQFGLFTDRAFCLFFDIAVQNGSVRNVGNVRFESNFTDMQKLQQIVGAVVSQTNKRWQDDVMARKSCILRSYGVVHGAHINFNFLDTSAFDFDITEDIDTLVGVIKSPDYWYKNAYDSHNCDAAYCIKIIQNYCQKILHITYTEYRNCVEILCVAGIINNPAFWLAIDNYVQGEYVNILIHRMTEKIKEMKIK